MFLVGRRLKQGKGMELESVIVGYTHLARALGGNKHERVMSETEALISRSALADPMASAQFMIAFARALKALEHEESSEQLLSSPQHQMAALLQSYLAERALQTGKVDALPCGLGLEVQFDEKDWLGWAGSFFTWVERCKGKVLLPPVQLVTRVPNDFRMAIIADWGTGLYGAPECAKSIAREKFDVIMHLGDVYYAGSAKEETSRFLKYWPGSNVTRNYALNSNHEMYSGGYGYMETLLRDNRFASNQTSSYFSLQNDYFLLLALDTAYEEHTIFDAQLKWLLKCLSEACDRKIVLFSHHQPFSIFEADDRACGKLRQSVSNLLQEHRVFAWYWGHEHRCIIYDRHPQYQVNGRCLGHGGYPHFRSRTPGLPPTCPRVSTFMRLQGKNGLNALLLDGPNPYITSRESEYIPNGYMTLSFHGNVLLERVHDPDGTVLFENTLQ
jgi:calcineurin-like phosphoesterase family protein